MKYRVCMSCYDGVEKHYYTTEVDGKDICDGAYQAIVKYAESTDYPKRLSDYLMADKIEEPNIKWIVAVGDNHLYPDDFKFTKSDWSGCYVSFNELNKMIDNGVITVNRDKLEASNE